MSARERRSPAGPRPRYAAGPRCPLRTPVLLGLLVLLATGPALAAKPVPIGHVPLAVGDHGHAEGRMTMHVEREADGVVLRVDGDVREAFDWEVLEVADGALVRLRVRWTAQSAGFATGKGAATQPGPLQGKTAVLVHDEHGDVHVVQGEATEAELADLPFTFADLLFELTPNPTKVDALAVGPIDPAVLPTGGPAARIASAEVIGLRRDHGRRLVAVALTATDPDQEDAPTVHGTMWIDPASGRAAGVAVEGTLAVPLGEGEPPTPAEMTITFRDGRS